MKTRILETKEVVRNTIFNAGVAEAQGATLLFKTQSFTAKKAFSTSVLEGDRDSSGLSPDFQVVEGRLRIDVLTDTMMRVRYAEGDSVP